MNKLLTCCGLLLLVAMMGACSIVPAETPQANPADLPAELASTPTQLPPTVAVTPSPSPPAPTAIIIDTSKTGAESEYFPRSDRGEVWNPFLGGLTIIFIPEGEFLMGSPQNSGGANYDEKPQRSVYLSGFYIDRTEVTNEQFATFLNVMGNQEQGRSTWLDAKSDYARIHEVDGIWQVDPGYELYPVVEVSWFGANSYCEWAGKRLPTEAEWEKAARGVDGRNYPWGDKIDCTLANFKGCAEEVAPVGSYPQGASPYGALDMAGNAMEWAADWYGEDYYKLDPVPDPLGPQEGNMRVMRGGSWLSMANFLRVALRDKQRPDDSGYINGFRCAFTP